MGIIDLIDKEKLVCTYCGRKPIVGFTFAVDVEISPADETITRELDQSSIIAVCKEHLPILQERFEKEMRDAEVIGELGGND